MALTTNFNVNPYYDDFDEDKNFNRILFKPGTAVQARELTQLQTIIQDQIKKFGDHIFVTGSKVTGGQITIQNCNYLNIASTFKGVDISANTFNEKVIYNTSNTKRALILKSYNAVESANEPITFIIKQLYGADFQPNETIYTDAGPDGNVSYYANLASANALGNTMAFSIGAGVFYYDGLFVKSQPQTVAIDKYSRQGNSRVGFVVSEEIIDYTEDTSLLDPAQGSSNFQAPGADRYRVSLHLDTRPLDSTDLTKFIELNQTVDGVPIVNRETPIYGPLIDELARRTYDESGDYIIKDFSIALEDSANGSGAYANVILGPGKAYIRGYEFGRESSTILEIPKPRTTDVIFNQRITTDYGYYIYANGMFNNFGTNQFANVELSALNTGQIINMIGIGAGSNLAVYNNTVIGNCKVKLQNFFVASANTDEPNNYVYRVTVTDINTTPIGSNSGYGTNATGGTVSTVIFPTGFSANSDVYKGMKIRMVKGRPRNLTSDNSTRTITAYDGSTRTATVVPSFSSAITTTDCFIIDTSKRDMESLVVRSATAGTTLVSYANVHPISKNESIGFPTFDGVTDAGFQPVRITDELNEPLLIKVGQINVADNSIADFSFAYKKLFTGVTFTNDVSAPLSLGSGESLVQVSSQTDKQKYYQVIVTTSTGSNYARGQTVPAQVQTIDAIAKTIQITGAGSSMVANVFATVSVSNPTSKSKVFIRANTLLVDPASSGSRTNSIFSSGNNNVYVAPLDGQTIINDTNLIQKKPGLVTSLYVADVYAINAVFDFNGTSVSTATYDALDKATGSSANVTDRYILSTGQKDSYYDWGGIILKPGQNPPKGPLVVRYERFKSTGSGFFNVDSYTRLGDYRTGGQGLDYGLIPTFTSQDGNQYRLNDFLDFRPVRKDAVNTSTANNFVLDVDASYGNIISEPGQEIITDYAYYLPRIDRVILNRNRQLKVIQGVPSLKPTVPEQPEQAMTLYVLRYLPYLTYPSSTGIQTFSNRRYTMKDVGLLDKRITNLELYTSLNIAEIAALNKSDITIRDQVGRSRPKNGVFVDSFVDRAAALITAPDFNAAIDILTQTCRGSYNIAATKIIQNGDNAIYNQNVELNGPLMMLGSTETTFVSQNKASKTMNINPFNVVNYFGTVRLDPNSDIWKSEDRIEAQNIDLSGGDAARDAWSSIESTRWNAWQTDWQSVTLDSQVLEGLAPLSTRAVANDPNLQGRVGATGGARAVIGDVTSTVAVSETREQTISAQRTGVTSRIVPQQLTKSLGDRMTDLTVVHFMREKNILVVGTKFKPFTSLNAFFDNVKVNKYLGRINRIEFDQSDLQFQTAISNAEAITIYKASSATSFNSSDTVIGSGGICLTSAKNGFIVSMSPVASFGSWDQCTNGIWVRGNITGKTYHASNWYHTTGRVLSATASTVVLNYHAGGAQAEGSGGTNDYVGQTLYIIAGTGKEQQATITAYDSTTRTITIQGTWNIIPDSTSTYSIGLVETTEEGATAAVFICPADTFRTGEKLFRLIDDEFGNIENSRTNGDCMFYASGITETRNFSYSLYTNSG
jgi:hypothetical protein